MEREHPWEAEAPASLEPTNLYPSNPSTASNLTPSDGPSPTTELQSQPNLASPRAPSSSQIKNQKSKIQSLYERRLAHDKKLEQLRAANRRGLPIMFEFDPADGPLPALSNHLKDPGYQPPPPPTQADEAQMVNDYLAQLRAQQLANA